MSINLPEPGSNQLIRGEIPSRWRLVQGRHLVAVNDRRSQWVMVGVAVLGLAFAVIPASQQVNPTTVSDLAIVALIFGIPIVLIAVFLYLLPGLKVVIDPESSVIISKRYGGLTYAKQTLWLTEGYLDRSAVRIPKMKTQTNWALVLSLMLGPLGLLFGLLFKGRDRKVLAGYQEGAAVVWRGFETREVALVLVGRRAEDIERIVRAVDEVLGVNPIDPL